VDTISKYVQQYKIGGLVFFQGGPVRQAALANRYQALAKVPLWFAIDGEWGLGMRLDSTIRFPYQMTLGAVQNDTLLYRMGLEVGRQCKRVGIHVNFAPVVDVNNNANNPVINFRSFGENKDNVARKSIAYMRGMQDAAFSPRPSTSRPRRHRRRFALRPAAHPARPPAASIRSNCTPSARSLRPARAA
jgi:beta-glucosidase-like glycosyl hydrolase